MLCIYGGQPPNPQASLRSNFTVAYGRESHVILILPSVVVRYSLGRNVLYSVFNCTGHPHPLLLPPPPRQPLVYTDTLALGRVRRSGGHGGQQGEPGGQGGQRTGDGCRQDFLGSVSSLFMLHIVLK